MGPLLLACTWKGSYTPPPHLKGVLYYRSSYCRKDIVPPPPAIFCFPRDREKRQPSAANPQTDTCIGCVVRVRVRGYGYGYKV
jgi:hypothetical protein